MSRNRIDARVATVTTFTTPTIVKIAQACHHTCDQSGLNRAKHGLSF